MTEIRVENALWAGAMAPEGVLAAWTVPDGAPVSKGSAIAEVLIEGARHDITAPESGCLVQDVQAPYVCQPDEIIGRIQPGLA